MRHTKIVCTLGPASLHRETLAAMCRAGMDVARLNTSHGTVEQHLAAVELVREVAKQEGKTLGVLMDLSGPKLRTGIMRNGSVHLQVGDPVRLTSEQVEGTADLIPVEYPRLCEDVLAGDRVLLDDGKIEAEVVQVSPEGLECRVIVGGELLSRKGVSFPRSNLTVPALTEADRAYIDVGVKAGVDFFALSFVRDGEDIARARQLIYDLGADIPIVAKIERRQAVEHLDDIMAEADGAMVARGDLGVELPPEDVPVQQRRIIEAAGRHMIPVITATQMLESMIDSPRPTRAESSDVANAVWDVSDALMLSGETAIGRYPVETVAMMDRIIRKAEEAMSSDTGPAIRAENDDHSYIVALAARNIVESDPNMRGIVCFTRSGYTAFLMSKVHSQAPVYGMTPDEAVCRRLSLARSVIPVQVPVVDSAETMLRLVDEVLVERRYAQGGEEVVVVASSPVQARGTTNFLKLHSIGESARY
ncbi:MAG: pyruvate kinase [Dehalococcoidia bacterium]|nr:pyruvate kinase [Dehalococcoidia bacterium]